MNKLLKKIILLSLLASSSLANLSNLTASAQEIADESDQSLAITDGEESDEAMATSASEEEATEEVGKKSARKKSKRKKRAQSKRKRPKTKRKKKSATRKPKKGLTKKKPRHLGQKIKEIKQELATLESQPDQQTEKINKLEAKLERLIDRRKARRINRIRKRLNSLLKSPGPRTAQQKKSIQTCQENLRKLLSRPYTKQDMKLLNQE